MKARIMKLFGLVLLFTALTTLLLGRVDQRQVVAQEATPTATLTPTPTAKLKIKLLNLNQSDLTSWPFGVDKVQKAFNAAITKIDGAYSPTPTATPT
jgi:hypothetical protein